MEEIKIHNMVSAMRKYGTSFVQSLAILFMQADYENTSRLLKAFPEYVEKYSKMAELDAQAEKNGDGKSGES